MPSRDPPDGQDHDGQVPGWSPDADDAAVRRPVETVGMSARLRPSDLARMLLADLDGWLVDNRFLGPMNGCAWYGHGVDGANLIEGNDFTAVRFTSNVAFRDGFPITAQQWPAGYRPLVDD